VPERRRFVIRSREIAERAAEFVLGLPMREQLFEVVVRLYRSRRTLEQNDYYWKLVRDIANFVGEPRVTVMSDILKAEILEPIRVYQTLKGETHKVYPHTSNMTVKELATFCEMIEAFAIQELGFVRHVDDRR